MMSSERPFDLESISYKDVETATNNFADENLIAQSSFAKLYKAPFLKSKEGQENMNVVVWRFTYGRYNMEFTNDFLMLGISKHKNIVSLVDVFVEVDELISVVKYEPNGSLDKHLSGVTLTWTQRLRICVGIARALCYIHYDLYVDDHLIHGNIKPSKILLDDNWEPKLFGFEVCILLIKGQQLALISEYRGTLQYMDPAYEKSRGLNMKSDVFSFGVVLFEVLFGRKASSVQNQNQDHLCFAKLARQHYQEGRLDAMIDPHLRQQMDSQSLKIFSETAYCCLKEQRPQRPDANQVVKKLERALELQLKYENPELQIIVDKGTSSHQWKGKFFDHLKISLHEIEFATNNFADTHLIGSGGYGLVYRAELGHYDNRINMPIKEKEEGDFPKTRSTVAIKRIVNIEGKLGFLAEIEMLISCKHKNIVSLLGFCDEGPHMILVYEHMSNGSLDDYFRNNNNLVNLTWARRIHMCLDIAYGLDYLHATTHDKQMIVHRDIKSANILLGNNLEAKIADFGLSKLRPMNQKNSTLMTNNIAGTEVYLDPEYVKTGKLKKEVDIYSFGVVLFEIMCGKVAYDEIYFVDNEKGLPSVARRRFNEGTLKEMVDSKIMESYENIFMINRGLNQDSLDTFIKIASQCLVETQAERPTTEVIIKELEKALSFEENHKDNLQISFEDIKLATKNFCHTNCVESRRYWKAYKGEVSHSNVNGRFTTIVAKRWESGTFDRRDYEFLTELETLFNFKHENIISLVGYCNEINERIIVYEHASNGSLDKHLNNSSLTWMKRLKICINVASGLGFLHSRNIIHKGIRSSSILLDGDWKAKVSDLDKSSEHVDDEKSMACVFHNAYDSLGYVDSSYKYFVLTEEFDVYSLGVVLFEVLCGRLAWLEGCEDHSQSLGPLAKCCYEEGRLDDMVFEGIKEQIVPQSFSTFAKVAYECLDDDLDARPQLLEVVAQLNKALEFQEDFEIWETKLPKDYKEIIHMSKTTQIYFNESKKALYDMLVNKGILLQEDKVWFSLGSNGERNEMISARKFSYKKRWLRKWRSVPQSRFPKVAELDISNIMIHIKIRTQFLTPSVNYKVYLIFKFCTPRKSCAKRMYVNLAYEKGKENLNAYFATWREDDWMMIELGGFLCQNEKTEFEVLLKSFSRCYCESSAIYVDGIEFQAINNVIHEKVDKPNEAQPSDNVLKHEEIEKFKEVKAWNNVKHEQVKKLLEVQQVMKSNSKWDKLRSLISEVNIKKDHILSTKELFSSFPIAYTRFEADNEKTFRRSENFDEGEELLSPSKVNTKEHHTLSAKEALYVASNVKILYLKTAVQARFQEVVELQSSQVICIKYKIGSQMLLPNTDYACYLVFKFSEKCHGLHCPVIVRDQLRWKNSKFGILYFRTPSPWDLHDNDQVSQMRDDGWMEISVWKFNSTHELRNDCVPMNLKLIAYEGTMLGLVVCGLEIRSK